MEKERDLEEEKAKHTMDSPNNSQQTVSDDEELDYSVKPEFYDSELDEKDELWAQKKRKGRTSDAVLSCPACFTTLSLDCQRHEKYLTQYRAVFVINCKVGGERLLHQSTLKPKGRKRQRDSDENKVNTAVGETFKQVFCQLCSTEVGALDEEEVYHFFNVLPSES